MDVVIDDKEAKYESRMGVHEKLPLVVTKYQVTGTTVEKFRPFVEDPIPTLGTINKRIKPDKLEEEDGYPIYNMWVESPNSWIVSHRSSIICVYK